MSDLKPATDIAFDLMSTDPRREVFAEIERLNLQQQVLELEEYGYTVVERLLDEGTLQRARQSILNQLERKVGFRPDPDSFDGELPLAHFLLFEDPVFEEILMNETMLALSSYLLGRSFHLSSMTCHARGPKNAYLKFHSDTPGPVPYSPHSIVANCNFALVDYTKEAGCISIVPRSHSLCRQPVSGEGDPYRNPHAKPIEVPAGSMILYHGNTWHGAYRRDIPGIRMNLAVYMCRNHVVPQELIRESVTPEMLSRNDERFAQLCGQNQYNGWREEGPDVDRTATILGAANRFG